MKTCLAILAAGALAAARGDAAAAGRGIPGYLGADGAFSPAAPAVPPAGATATPFSGTITAILTLAVAEDVPASATPTCTLQASVYGPGDSYLEYSTAAGTLSGATLTCTVQIAYRWTLYNGSSDTVAIQATVAAKNSAGIGREVDFDFPVFAVPGNGAATTFRYAGRI